MTFRTDLLANVVYPLRFLPSTPTEGGLFDIRTSRVIVRSRVWSSGTQVNLGVATITNLEIAPRPKVIDQGNEVLQVIVTPVNAKGGYSFAQLRPDDVAATEYVYIVIGPDGVERPYCLTSIDTRRSFRTTLTLQPTGMAVPF